jgi:2'-5' RNA ligase
MRVFIAFDVDDPKIVDEVEKIQGFLIGEGVKGTFPKGDQLHVTVKFLGETPDDKVMTLQKLLSEIDVTEFYVRFDGVGGFPSLSYPRVVVVKIVENEILYTLFKEIERVTSKLGYPREGRPFKPHLTICRVKKKWSWKKHLKSYLSGISLDLSMKIDRFKLKKSVLTPSGPIYEDIYTFKLEG